VAAVERMGRGAVAAAALRLGVKACRPTIEDLTRASRTYIARTFCTCLSGRERTELSVRTPGRAAALLAVKPLKFGGLGQVAERHTLQPSTYPIWHGDSTKKLPNQAREAANCSPSAAEPLGYRLAHLPIRDRVVPRVPTVPTHRWSKGQLVTDENGELFVGRAAVVLGVGLYPRPLVRGSQISAPGAAVPTQTATAVYSRFSRARDWRI